MGESHTEERESHFLNLFHTSLLADLHNGTFAAAVFISLTYSQMGAANGQALARPSYFFVFLFPSLAY